MAPDDYEIESGHAITSFICRRTSLPTHTVRKFRAKCGNKIIVKVAGRTVVQMEFEHDEDCPACLEQSVLIKSLVESGK